MELSRQEKSGICKMITSSDEEMSALGYELFNIHKVHFSLYEQYYLYANSKLSSHNTRAADLISCKKKSKYRLRKFYELTPPHSPLLWTLYRTYQKKFKISYDKDDLERFYNKYHNLIIKKYNQKLRYLDFTDKLLIYLLVKTNTYKITEV